MRVGGLLKLSSCPGRYFPVRTRMPWRPGAIANHRDAGGFAEHAFDRKLEELGRRLAEHSRLFGGSIFERHDERPGIEREFMIMVEKVAIFGESEKTRAVNEFSKGLV